MSYRNKLTEARFREALQQQRNVRQLSGLLRSPANTIYPWIKRLASEGKIERIGESDDVRAGSGACWKWKDAA